MNESQSSAVNIYKVVVVGTSGVGKTSLVQALKEGKCSDDIESTIGVECQTYYCDVDGERIKLNLWDTAGQEKYKSISHAYFRNAVGAILVFSLTDRQSFEDLDEWVNDLQSLSHPDAEIILVGNKSDLKTERVISDGEVRSYSQRHRFEYIETSAKELINVTSTFLQLAQTIHRNVGEGKIRGSFSLPTSTPSMFQPLPTEEKQSGCGC